VTGSEFLRKLNKLARERKVPFAYDPRHGKGSHGRVFYGAFSTALKDPKKELGPGLLGKMRRDLGIGANDL
jgi:mRNA interferase HicA